jgi:hypothetical protein
LRGSEIGYEVFAQEFSIKTTSPTWGDHTFSPPVHGIKGFLPNAISLRKKLSYHQISSRVSQMQEGQILRGKNVVIA